MSSNPSSDHPHEDTIENAEFPLAAQRKSLHTRGKYSSRACQECRRRRAKCDGAKPSCGRCGNRKTNCVYVADQDLRGSAPRSYMRMLQSRLEELEQVLCSHAIDVDKSVAALREQRASNAIGTFHPNITECPVEIDGVVHANERLFAETDGEGHYYGPSSGRTEIATHEGSDNPESGLEDRIRRNAYHQALAGEVPPEQGLEAELIDLYFEHEHVWYPVVNEQLFREHKRLKGRFSSELLVNCILAVASRYLDRVEVRSDPDDANTAGRIFLEKAEVLLHFDLKRPSITTVQSLAILGVMNVAIGSDAAGWLYHGMAIRLALDMGFNLDSAVFDGQRTLSVQETDLRKQIYWSLYNNDKLSASYTGRVCTMLDSQAMVDLPQQQTATSQAREDNGPSFLREVQTTSLHCALSVHCQILEKIMTNLYGPKRLIHQTQKQAFSDSHLLTLKGWFYSLPQSFKLGKNGGEVMPSTYVLHMIYYTSIILLSKPLLQGNSRSGQSTQGSGSRIHGKAALSCLQAAREIAILCEGFRTKFGSFRRCPLPATHCTLTAVLVLTQIDGQLTDDIDQSKITHITSCLHALQELSLAWKPAGRYWRAITQKLQNDQRVKEPRAPTTTSEARNETEMNWTGNQTALDPLASLSCPSKLQDDTVNSSTRFLRKSPARTEIVFFSRQTEIIVK